MGSFDRYLVDRFRTHTRVAGGVSYTERLDRILLEHVWKEIPPQQRIDLPLARIREEIRSRDPLLMAFSSNDETYVRETVAAYVSEAFTPASYGGFGGLIDPRIAEAGSTHARTIRRIKDRLGSSGGITGPRLYRTTFERSYKLQHDLQDQKQDVAEIERLCASNGSVPSVVRSAFKAPDPFFNWLGDALALYHEFRFNAESLSTRGHEHLSASSNEALVDHLAGRAIGSILDHVLVVVEPKLEREIFPGDEVEPLALTRS